MHWMGWLIYGLAVCWLIPASLFRPVALVLLANWTLAEFVFVGTGDFEPIYLYLAGDMAVLAAVIFFRSHWSDWLIIMPIPAMWWLYTQPETQAQWEALYWLTVAQFVIAGPWPALKRNNDNKALGRVGKPVLAGLNRTRSND